MTDEEFEMAIELASGAHTAIHKANRVCTQLKLLQDIPFRPAPFQPIADGFENINKLIMLLRQARERSGKGRP